VLEQAHEVEIAQRRHEAQVLQRLEAGERPGALQRRVRAGMDGKDRGRLEPPQQVHEAREGLVRVHVPGPVHGHQEIFALAQPELLERVRGTLRDGRHREAHVGHHVAHQPRPRGAALALQVGHGGRRRAQAQVADVVRQHAVALLRHGPVGGAHAGLDVGKRCRHSRARQGPAEGRVGVAVDEHEVRPHLLQDRLERMHDASDLVGVRARSDSQPPVGGRQVELPEEHVRQLVVVVLAAVDQELVVALAQPPRDGRGLHELRAVADQADYPHRSIDCAVR
jgi:hypothetical protein